MSIVHKVLAIRCDKCGTESQWTTWLDKDYQLICPSCKTVTPNVTVVNVSNTMSIKRASRLMRGLIEEAAGENLLSESLSYQAG